MNNYFNVKQHAFTKKNSLNFCVCFLSFALLFSFFFSSLLSSLVLLRLSSLPHFFTFVFSSSSLSLLCAKLRRRETRKYNKNEGKKKSTKKFILLFKNVD